METFIASAAFAFFGLVIVIVLWSAAGGADLPFGVGLIGICAGYYVGAIVSRPSRS